MSTMLNSEWIRDRSTLIQTSSPSMQGRSSLRKVFEIISAVSVCRVKSGIRSAHLIHVLESTEIFARNAVAPPNDLPSLSNP